MSDQRAFEISIDFTEAEQKAFSAMEPEWRELLMQGIDKRKIDAKFAEHAEKCDVCFRGMKIMFQKFQDVLGILSLVLPTREDRLN